MSDWIKLTPEELAEFMPEDIDNELLSRIARNISGYLTATKMGIDTEERKKASFKHLKKAVKSLNLAMSELSEAKDCFSPNLYKVLIYDGESEKEVSRLLDLADSERDDKKRDLLHYQRVQLSSQKTTLNDAIRQVKACIPESEPIWVQNRKLEHLFEIMRLECEKGSPDMTWYAIDYVSDEINGEFISLCKLSCKKMEIELSLESIKRYLRETVRPNREKMKQHLDKK